MTNHHCHHEKMMVSAAPLTYSVNSCSSTGSTGSNTPYCAAFAPSHKIKTANRPQPGYRCACSMHMPMAANPVEPFMMLAFAAAFSITPSDLPIITQADTAFLP
jgi:hypothetical protein